MITPKFAAYSKCHLPRWANDVINNPPYSGEGFHKWLFRAALVLVRCGWDIPDIEQLLRKAASSCGRYVSEREINESINNAYKAVYFSEKVFYRTFPKWPKVNQEQINIICRNGQSLGELKNASPILFENEVLCVEEIIDILFPGNPLLCVGKTNSSFNTLLREEWRGKLSVMQFIVPSYMTAKVGKTKGGKISAHTLENTGRRCFIICEFDKGTVDQQASLLLHLASYAPMVLVVHSGGKSLHGWFYCYKYPEDRVKRFMAYAVSLGADQATWTRSQFVRLPGGLRDNGNRQVVHLFNPGVLQ